MAEPTLGQRIAEAADAYAMAFAKATELGAYAPLALHRKRDLRALCDRADAAERLARCCDRLNDNGYDDYLSALAAWREVGE